MRLPIQASPVQRANWFAAAGSRPRGGVVPQDNCSVCTDVLAALIYADAKAACWLGCNNVATAVSIGCDAAFAEAEEIGALVCPGISQAVSNICHLMPQGCDGLQNWDNAKSAAATVCRAKNVC